MNVRANDASIQDGEGTRTGRLSLSLMLCTCVFPRRLLRVETEREKGEGRNRLRWNARARSSTTSLTTTICSMLYRGGGWEGPPTRCQGEPPFTRPLDSLGIRHTRTGGFQSPFQITSNVTRELYIHGNDNPVLGIPVQ